MDERELRNQEAAQEKQALSEQPPQCQYCAGEPEPHWIEMPNNGPIVPCPVCNPDGAIERR